MGDAFRTAGYNMLFSGTCHGNFTCGYINFSGVEKFYKPRHSGGNAQVENDAFIFAELLDQSVMVAHGSLAVQKVGCRTVESSYMQCIGQNMPGRVV